MLILERPSGLDSSAAGKINQNFKKICFTQFFAYWQTDHVCQVS